MAGVETKIIDGQDGLIFNDKTIKVRVTKDFGYWQLFIDTVNQISNNYMSQGSSYDSTITSS